MSEKRFTKIKHKGGKTEILWTTRVEENGDETKSELTSFDDPEPEFIEALQALKADVLKLLELPTEYGEGLTVTGLSLSYTEGRMGVVVTCLKDLLEANSPLVLNTPHLPEPDFDDVNPQMNERDAGAGRGREAARRAVPGRQAGAAGTGAGIMKPHAPTGPTCKRCQLPAVITKDGLVCGCTGLSRVPVRKEER